MGIISFHPSSLALAQLCTRCMDDTLQAKLGQERGVGLEGRPFQPWRLGTMTQLRMKGVSLSPAPLGAAGPPHLRL